MLPKISWFFFFSECFNLFFISKGNLHCKWVWVDSSLLSVLENYIFSFWSPWFLIWNLLLICFALWCKITFLFLFFLRFFSLSLVFKPSLWCVLLWISLTLSCLGFKLLNWSWISRFRLFYQICFWP